MLYTDVIPELFARNSTVPGTGRRGEALARLWAASAHGTAYALRTVLDTDAAVVDPVTGSASVPFVNTTPRVEQTMTLVMIAYMYALDAQRDLLGWRSDRLDDAIARSREIVLRRFGIDEPD